MHPRSRNLLLTTTALLALGTAFGLLLGAAPVEAGPNGGAVVGGSATISGQGSAAVIVNQSSNSAIINWNTFNVGVGQSVTFNQPNSSSIALNRVTGGLGPSEILGTLTANGRVFIINRDGVLFGPGAVINTAGFLASTNDIKNSDFLAGRMNFNIAGRPDASIVNLGRITATSGGFAALVAPGVRNSGTITATLGTVTLAAGNSFTLDMYGDRLITLAVNDQIASKVIDVATGKTLKSLVTNDGKIKANGGRVELTAAAARAVVDSVINTSGVIKANSIGHHNGMIVLSAATGGSKPQGAPTQTIKISGTLSAAGKRKGTTGGTILVTGENIQLASAKVDASGRAGGGKVLIGGDWAGGHPTSGLINNQSAQLENYLIPTATTVSVDAGTTINASATGSGNGGKVILWSDVQTTFAGTILAQGGPNGGNGGFVETSGHQQLAFTGNVDTRAPNGTTGTLLLDPGNLTIADTGSNSTTAGPGTFTGSNTADSTLLVSTLLNALNTTNVTVQTGTVAGFNSGDIIVAANIGMTSSNTLTLSAYHDVVIRDGVTISSSGGGSLVLRADSTGLGSGTVSFGADGNGHVNVSNGGSVSIFYNPSSYTSPTDYSGKVSISGGGALTAYMLVNNATDLDNVRTNLAGTYALGTNITDFTDFANFAPIGGVSTPFTGIFDGQNHTISHLTIAPNDFSTNNIGLFATIGPSGIVRNLTLDQVSVTANRSVKGGQFVGTLAGQNAGLISNVIVTNGVVNGAPVDTVLNGIIAGGLVGQNGIFNDGGVNRGTILASSAAVNVTVGDAASGNQANYAGGLVGVNPGIIDGSSASGIISSGSNGFAGGLVGANFDTGTITNSSSSSTVSGATGADADFGSGVGGLVGFNQGSISGSFATGPVSGTTPNVDQQYAIIIGGLVGLNNGQITNSYSSSTVTASGSIEMGGLVGGNFGPITGSYATGHVSGSGDGSVGGLVGLNGVAHFDDVTLAGSVTGSNATGAVDGTGSVQVGGLVGQNQSDATITNSFAIGAVTATTTGAVDISAGGLVGDNSGLITGSHATGSVTSNFGDATVGGLAGTSSPDATISNSFATGNVTVNGAAQGWGGGLVGGNAGTINGVSFATGNVSVNATVLALAGGLIAYNIGDVDHAYATGSVNVSGTTGIAGGFVGVNGGFLNQTFATGSVGGSATDSVLGGFAGVNTNSGTIVQAYSNGAVTGGGNSVIGGFVGVNVGSLDQTYANGKLTGGATTGGLVAANTSAPLGALNDDPNIGPTLTGTGTTTKSYWDTQTTGVSISAGGTGVPTTGLIAALPAGFDHSVWTIQPDPSYPYFPWQPLNTIPMTNEPPPDVQPAPQPQIINNLVNNVQLVSLNTAPVVAIQNNGALQPSFPPPVPPGGQPPGGQPPGFGQPPQFSFPRIIDIPVLTETRLVKDEVVVQIRCDTTTVPQIQEAVRRLNLALTETQNLCTTTGTTALRFKFANGQTIQSVIRALASVRIVAVAQPNYIYALVQAPAPAPAGASDPTPAGASDPTPASRGDTAQQGDAAQYILQKLRISDVHRVVRGTNVPIAVIDSEIDAAHPDLAGVIVQRFSAVGAQEKPHSHGTGMAGAIASHQRLMGMAPSSRLYAVHAFSSNAANAESTTFNILKGIDWASNQGVRIINMSFAGPKDPSLERALKAAYDKGIVLIAAAGNAGPKSPPLYPGADPSVIAVTATDADDKLFAGANRGKYVSVAAPGVDVLVPAPEGAYQLTTGTSVAAAEVSGIVALLLERNPKLTPADIRRILTTSAKRLSVGERDDDFGSGLVDPLGALQGAEPRTVTTTPPLRQR